MIDSEQLINDLCRQGFCIIDGFLEQTQCQSLRETAQELYEQGLFRGAKIGLKLELHKNDSIRTDEILWLEGNARDEINQFIEKTLIKLNPFTYKERLDGMQTRFYQWVENTDKKELADAFEKIHAITQPRYLLEDYILHLERIKIKEDELYATRLSLAKRFLGYLFEQTELTPAVAEVIATYVNSLRELQPGKGEVEQLDRISPPSTLEQTWRKVTAIGISFFSIVLGDKSIGEVISGNSIIINSVDSPSSNLKK